MKTKMFISQPMNGRTEEEIIKERRDIAKLLPANCEMLDTLFDLDTDNPIMYLAKSIEKLAEADCVIFIPGWEDARGCKIEFEIAKAYGKVIVIL